MGRKRKNYSSRFKTKVALEAVKDQLTISEIASKYEVHPNMVSTWKRQLLEGATEIFEDKRKKKSDAKPEQQVEHLYQQIGQMKVEADWLKKKLGL